MTLRNIAWRSSKEERRRRQEVLLLRRRGPAKPQSAYGESTFSLFPCVFMGFCAWQNRNCQSEYCLSRRDFFFNRKLDMSFSEADRMELGLHLLVLKKMGLFAGQFSWRTKIWLEVNGDLQVRDDLEKKFSCQSGLYLTLFFSFYFRKIEAKQNKSHRMQNTSTSRSTDFRRQKTITSKTPLTLYGRGFCASDRTPTTTASPDGPQSNQNVWVLPPISRNDERPGWLR